MRSRAWPLNAGGFFSAVGLALLLTAGCASWETCDTCGAGIDCPLAAPELPPANPPSGALPSAPTQAEAVPAPAPLSPGAPPPAGPLPPPNSPSSAPPTEVLRLEQVLQSVQTHFPLLLAVEQERGIAAGQGLAAAGAFDFNVRGRGSAQDGTFENQRFDLLGEQATTFRGASFFGGYRGGYGDFPVYYGDRLTADGGEFRGGITIPLLRDAPIDRRRAALRQAQIQQSLADPVIQRARIDYLRAAARAYWNWIAATEQYFVADALLRIARDRQAGLEEQFKRGQASEFVVVDNRRAVAEREGALVAADRRFQQTSLDLSLFWRDAGGQPLTPAARQAPRGFLQHQPPPPQTALLASDVETAHRRRPELQRFAWQKQRATVDLQLAQNQTYPALNAVVVGSQDVGDGKKSTGIFALDRSNVEGAITLDVPLQRREAKGRILAAQATLAQLLAQERFARDQIAVEVQDAVSNLDRTYQRLLRARDEQRAAQRVAEMERERFVKGQSNLLEVNLRELAAAGAQAKVVETLADYYRAQADHRAALGLDVDLAPDETTRH